MGEQKPIFEQIERLQNASNYGFRFVVTADGKFDIKVDDINRSVSKTYQSICNISDSTPAERDFTEYATSIKVYYNIDLSSGNGPYVIVDTYETDTFNKYRVKKQLEYKSLLTSQSDAESKGDLIALDYSEARNKITFELETIERLEQYDIVQIDLSVYNGLTVKRDYFGTRKIKVSEVKWDFSQEKTIVTGYDITDI